MLQHEQPVILFGNAGEKTLHRDSQLVDRAFESRRIAGLARFPFVF